jgi:hypothetical protein
MFFPIDQRFLVNHVPGDAQASFDPFPYHAVLLSCDAKVWHFFARHSQFIVMKKKQVLKKTKASKSTSKKDIMIPAKRPGPQEGERKKRSSWKLNAPLPASL